MAEFDITPDAPFTSRRPLPHARSRVHLHR